MDAALIDRIETNVERAASALFGGAAGFAAYRLLGGVVPQPELVAWTGGTAAFATLLSRRALIAAAASKPRFDISIFDVREIDPFETDELLLTAAERIGAAELILTDAERMAPDELLLSDSDRLHAGELVLTDADRLHAGELVLTDADRLHAGELLLTEADRLDRQSKEPLVLDDILTELGPDARVVRLFDRKAMPTPGQLKSRIDTHLEQGSSTPAQSDASQALSQALAELRRSLR